MLVIKNARQSAVRGSGLPSFADVKCFVESSDFGGPAFTYTLTILYLAMQIIPAILKPLFTLP